MVRQVLVAAVVVLVLTSCASAANKASDAHKLIVAVKKNAVLVLITQNGGPPAAAGATPSKPLTVLLDNSGLYRVKAEINSSCTGSCTASYRISGSANHKLEVVPTCRPKASGVACTKLAIVKLY